MTKYIPKEALVAEINKRISRNKKRKEWEDIPEKRHQLIIEGQLLGELKHFLDTLEVKEVDLEKQLKEDIEEVFFDLNGVAVKGATHYLTVEDVKDIAKYFFELGMQVSNKAQKGE